MDERFSPDVSVECFGDFIAPATTKFCIKDRQACHPPYKKEANERTLLKRPET